MSKPATTPCSIGDLSTAVRALLESARTGEVGDGKVFVLTVDQVYRVPTGERDQLAVTPEPRHGELRSDAP